MHLKAECVLQVVARLFGVQPRHDGRAFGDVDDHQVTSFRKVMGDLPKSIWRGHLVAAGAQLTLAQRTDVAEFTDAVVAVVVGEPCA